MGGSESQTFLSPRFVSFTWRYHAARFAFALGAGVAHHIPSQGFYPGIPSRHLVMETFGPPRFLDEPQCERALFFDPGGTHCARPLRRLSMAVDLTKPSARHME